MELGVPVITVHLISVSSVIELSDNLKCGRVDLVIVCFQKSPIPPPWRITRNSKGEGGLKVLKFFKGKYDPKLEFPEGWGSNQKTPHWGSIDIFWKNPLFLC